MQDWVSGKSVRACGECLAAMDIPCGPIATVEQFAGEPNLLHRGMIHFLRDPVSESPTHGAEYAV